MNSKTKVLTTAAFTVFAASLAVGGWAWAQESSSEQEHPTAPQLIESLKPELNEEQEAALADGVLTREEYDAALDRVVVCLEAEGLTVHREPGRGPGGVDQIWTESPASAGGPRDVVLGCYERHQGKLSMVWAEQNRPTADEFAAHASAVDSCMASKGVAPKPLSELWDKEDDRTAYFECLGEVPPPGRDGP
jgi:hypothetical protein